MHLCVPPVAFLPPTLNGQRAAARLRLRSPSMGVHSVLQGVPALLADLPHVAPPAMFWVVTGQSLSSALESVIPGPARPEALLAFACPPPDPLELVVYGATVHGGPGSGPWQRSARRLSLTTFTSYALCAKL